MREDRHTSTIDGARGFERRRDPLSIDPYDDAPTMAEVGPDMAEHRAWTRARRQEEAAARARGEYVPSNDMKMAAFVAAVRIAREGVVADVVPVREGVFRVETDRPDAASEALAEHVYERKVVEGTLWLRAEMVDLQVFPMP